MKEGLITLLLRLKAGYLLKNVTTINVTVKKKKKLNAQTERELYKMKNFFLIKSSIHPSHYKVCLYYPLMARKDEELEQVTSRKETERITSLRWSHQICTLTKKFTNQNWSNPPLIHVIMKCTSLSFWWREKSKSSNSRRQYKRNEKNHKLKLIKSDMYTNDKIQKPKLIKSSIHPSQYKVYSLTLWCQSLRVLLSYYIHTYIHTYRI